MDRAPLSRDMEHALNPLYRCATPPHEIVRFHLTYEAGDGAAGQLVRASIRPNTERAYVGAFARFDHWCAATHLPTGEMTARFEHPFAPESLAEYIAQLHKQGAAMMTLTQAVSAVRAAFKATGRPIDEDSAAWKRVAAVVKGARAEQTEQGGRGRGPANALRLEDLHAAVAALARVRGPTMARARRDRALLLIGYLGGLRRAELAALDCSDLTTTAEGLSVRVRGAKTTRDEITRADLPRGRHPTFCPVTAWQDWRELAPPSLPGIDAPAFVATTRSGRPIAERIGDDQIGRTLRRALALGGIEDPSRYSAHSLRAGLATELAEKGVPIPQIANAGRWESLDTVLRYARRARRWQDSPLHALGY